MNSYIGAKGRTYSETTCDVCGKKFFSCDYRRKWCSKACRHKLMWEKEKAKIEKQRLGEKLEKVKITFKF